VGYEVQNGHPDFMLRFAIYGKGRDVAAVLA